MNQFTYGDFQSAINLANILNKQNKKIQRKAGAMLNLYRRWLNALRISEIPCYEALSGLIVREAQEKITATPVLPDVVKTHMISVIKTERKRLLRDEKTIRKTLLMSYRQQGLSYHKAKKHAHLDILTIYSHD